MTTTHLRNAARNSVSPPQSEPLREDQVPNSAGGFVWEADKWARLRRFLILGTAGGTYYIGEKDLTKEGLDTIKACLAEDGGKTVSLITRVSIEGRASKNDYAIFALACAVAFGDDLTKTLALLDVPNVCRIGTHLFMFAGFLDAFGCLTGRAKRRALAGWYASKPADKLAYDVIKYRQRDGWSHRDILRLSHPGSISEVPEENANILAWVAGKGAGAGFLPDTIEGFEMAQDSESPEFTAELVAKYGLPREALKTEHLKSPVVWEALIHAGMPMTAMIRNLGNMTKVGLLTSQSEATDIVVEALGNEEKIRRARIHPFSVLLALKTYGGGTGYLSRSPGWTPVTRIVNALDSAFYTAFGNVEPTGKRILLGLDISSSMSQSMQKSNLTCYEAEAAMALVTEAVEDKVEIMGFNTRFESMPISSRQRLDDVVKVISSRGFGGTDCALPMLYAAEKGLEFDAFVIYTDSETWAGRKHPATALNEYRMNFVPDARLAVVAFAANRFSIADPTDAGMLDIVGFDTASPNILSDFIAGRI